MAELRLTPAALGDLEDIWIYTVQQWGAAQAERYVDTLNACFEAIAQTPLSAPSCAHIRAGYRRQRVERHAVYYRVEEAAVVIVRVLHERMDAIRHL